MCKLYNWYLSRDESGRRIAKGVVTGHYRLSDGKFIHTSRIIGVEMDGDTAMIRTKNSLYKCSMKDALYDEFEYTHMIDGFDEYRERFGQQTEEPANLNEGEVLIRLGNNREYYFDSVRMKYKGCEECIDCPDVHVGMFQDSVLSRFYEYEDYGDSRYFDYWPYKGRHVEFYSWDDTGLNVYIENVGDDKMYATVKGNVYSIQPGEKKMITKENRENEVPQLSTEDLHNVF